MWLISTLTELKPSKSKRVGDNSGVTPKIGQREPDPKRPRKVFVLPSEREFVN